MSHNTYSFDVYIPLEAMILFGAALVAGWLLLKTSSRAKQVIPVLLFSAAVRTVATNAPEDSIWRDIATTLEQLVLVVVATVALGLAGVFVNRWADRPLIPAPPTPPDHHESPDHQPAAHEDGTGGEQPARDNQPNHEPAQDPEQAPEPEPVPGPDNPNLVWPPEHGNAFNEDNNEFERN